MTDHERIRLYAMANLLEKEEPKPPPRWDVLILPVLVGLVAPREWFFLVGAMYLTMTLSF